MHPTNESTIHELAAMSQHLQDYLLDDRLYKTVTVSSGRGERLIKMTIGAMLERMDELESSSLAGAAAPVLEQAQEALQRARRSQTDQFYQMLGREAKSYTDSWNWFLQNCWEGDRKCRSDYAQEVGLRLRLERLLEEGGEHPALADSRQRVRALDERLRAIWEEQETPVVETRGTLPSDRYWWLYGRPRPQMDGS